MQAQTSQPPASPSGLPGKSTPKSGLEHWVERGFHTLSSKSVSPYSLPSSPFFSLRPSPPTPIIPSQLCFPGKTLFLLDLNGRHHQRNPRIAGQGRPAQGRQRTPGGN